jgi:hypothetical protein
LNLKMSRKRIIAFSKSIGRNIVIGGGFIRPAVIQDEEWIEGEAVVQPATLICELRDESPADLLSFARPLPHCDPSYPFHYEWDNVAVAKLGQFAQWWEALPQETRKNVRRAQRRGVTVNQVKFDDQFVHGICRIYNETPLRQGRKFWHYGKTFDQVKAENSTYLDRSEFIGAFFGGELIGFIKFVMVNDTARIMQIVSLEAHTDKRPTNALLAKAVEICCEMRASHLVYGKYVYGRKESSPVTEFKRRNGFERLRFPRYYVPLTRLGAIVIRCGMHRELSQILPGKITDWFLAARAAVYRRRFGTPERLPKPANPEQSPPAGHSSIAI